jgi:WD40 repeat protein
MQAVFSVTISPDNLTMATGAGGKESVKLWQVSTGQKLLTLTSKKSLLKDIFFAEGGNTILLGRFQGPRSWQMLRAPSWEVINAAEAQGPTLRTAVGPNPCKDK